MPIGKSRLFALLLTFGAGLMPATAPVHGEAPATPRKDQIDFSTDPLVLAKTAIGDFRGIAAIGVWRENKFTFAAVQDGIVLDPAKIDGADSPIFEIGSVTKVFTALLVAQSVERGDLALNDRLGALLGGKTSFSSRAVADITLQQLLTHTSCLPNLPPDFREVGAQEPDAWRLYDGPRLYKTLGRLEVKQGAPCKASYSNFGYAVLGELLAERYKTPWSELVRKHITEPLHMRSTFQHPGDNAARLAPGYQGGEKALPMEVTAFAGAGALRSTPGDMLIFARALAAGKSGPLGLAAERVVTPLAWFKGEIGYGMRLRGPAGNRIWTHNGGTFGQQTLLLIAPDTKEALIAFVTNAKAPLYDVYRGIMGSRYHVSMAPYGKAQILSDFVGLYHLKDEDPVYVATVNDRLYLRFKGEAFVELAPVGPGEFMTDDETVVHFDRDGTGVRSVRVDRGGVSDIGLRDAARLSVLARVPEELSGQYIGRYKVDKSIFDVRSENGQLSMQLDDQPRYPVFVVPGQTDQFFYDNVPATITFVRSGGGNIDGLVFHQTKTLRAIKIR